MPRGRPLTQADVDVIVQMRADNEPNSAIAARLGVHPATLDSRIARLVTEGRVKQRENPANKARPERELVAQVVNLRLKGFTESTILRRTGLSATRFQRILALADAELEHAATKAAGQGERRESEAPPPAANSIVMSLMARGLSREKAERQAKWEMHKRAHGLRVTEPAW